MEDPKKQLQCALKEISEWKHSTVTGISKFYTNPPLGPQDQPSFINGVIRIETSLNPISLLDELQALEKLHHRVRNIHWGPRTLDLDLIMYGSEEINQERLIVPHPQMEQRNFVLKPLLDIDEELTLPNGKKIADLCKKLDCKDLEEICILSNTNQLEL